ncbi:hypothetical protein [Streptomyces sp. NPDC048438]|uniref:hypothetical protein n=1 Tax=Streptomyces sp. NPDC048438 TaxID=3365551 RepID=UPI00371F0B2C
MGAVLAELSRGEHGVGATVAAFKDGSPPLALRAPFVLALDFKGDRFTSVRAEST